jgi:hypothetical protein
VEAARAGAEITWQKTEFCYAPKLIKVLKIQPIWIISTLYDAPRLFSLESSDKLPDLLAVVAFACQFGYRMTDYHSGGGIWRSPKIN